MKKYILIFAIIYLSNCQSNNEFLKEDPKGQILSENFFNNVTELEMMNNGLYSIWNWAINRNYESMEIKFACSDDILGTGNQRVYYNEMEINLDISSGGNQDIQRGWERAYNCINQANTIINNIQNAAGTVSEAEINSYAAQAHFIRGFMYFWLVRFFNNIPLITDAYIADTKREVTLTPAREVYDLVISDLQYAEQYLPVKWTGVKMTGGAVTKGAAQSLLSKVYLQMAGFPLNLGNDYYAKARDKAKEVIDRADEYGYALREHFYQVWDPYWEAYSIPKDEIIIWLEHSTTGDNVSHRSPCASRPIEMSGWESWVTEKYFYEHFPEGERKEFTFVTDFYHQDGKYYHYTDLKCAHPCYRKMYAEANVPDWEWENRNDPTSRWLTNMSFRPVWYGIRPTLVMRYPDILLTYAEAKARTDGPDALAYQCLNDVRNRAFKGLGTTEASVSGLSREAFIDAVIWERAYEFAGFEHSHRWFDLVRLELVEKANTEWRDEPEEKYNLIKPYTKKDYFLKIPDREVQLNPNLANNTGY